MIIQKAEKEDLQEILDLQYLAYQSEAKLCNNPEIPPLKQTLPELLEEYRKGIVLKVVEDSNAIIGSVRGYSDKGTVYIGKLFVSPKEQGKGIGKRDRDKTPFGNGKGISESEIRAFYKHEEQKEYSIVREAWL